MEYTLTNENVREVKSLLEGFLSQGGKMKHEYNVSIEDPEVIKKIENSDYNEETFGAAKAFYVEDSASINGKKILLAVEIEGKFASVSTLVLYEGDVVQKVSENTMLVEQKSSAVASILGKKNVVTIYKNN